MGRYFAPCKICIPHIPVGYAGGTNPWKRKVEIASGTTIESNAGAVAERLRKVEVLQALAVA